MLIDAKRAGAEAAETLRKQTAHRKGTPQPETQGTVLTTWTFSFLSYPYSGHFRKVHLESHTVPRRSLLFCCLFSTLTLSGAIQVTKRRMAQWKVICRLFGRAWGWQIDEIQGLPIKDLTSVMMTAVKYNRNPAEMEKKKEEKRQGGDHRREEKTCWYLPEDTPPLASALLSITTLQQLLSGRYIRPDSIGCWLHF